MLDKITLLYYHAKQDDKPLMKSKQPSIRLAESRRLLKGGIRVDREWTSEGDRKPIRQVAVNGFPAPVTSAGLYDGTRQSGRLCVNLGGTAGFFLSLDFLRDGFFVFMEV